MNKAKLFTEQVAEIVDWNQIYLKAALEALLDE